jgi:hypothetical protein
MDRESRVGSILAGIGLMYLARPSEPSSPRRAET